VIRNLLALVAAAALTAGCAGFPGFPDTHQGTGSVALSGMAGGAAIGSIAGDTGWGAATSSYAYDKSQKAQQ
jgi:hypothetical protein